MNGNKPVDQRIAEKMERIEGTVLELMMQYRVMVDQYERLKDTLNKKDDVAFQMDSHVQELEARLLSLRNERDEISYKHMDLVHDLNTKIPRWVFRLYGIDIPSLID